jgi:hypothetical protein
MRGMRWSCCARAESGHAAAPLMSEMNSRRFIGSPRLQAGEFLIKAHAVGASNQKDSIPRQPRAVALQDFNPASKVVFFIARNHFINLVRKPGRIAIIQGCAPGGYIGDRVGWGCSSQLGPSTLFHEMPTVRQGLCAGFLCMTLLMVNP